MRVIGVCHFRNEADILEAFIRHTLAYCSRLLLLDHGSSDGSPEIVMRLQKEGLPIELLSDPTPGHVEVEHSNRLCRLAALEFSADWVLVLDADEFIHGGAAASFLPEDQSTCLKIPLRNYYPCRDDVASIVNPVERIVHRVNEVIPATAGTSRFKIIVPGELLRKGGGMVTQGNHRFLIGPGEAPFRVLQEVTLAHYSLRTPGQYAIKLTSKQLQQLRHIPRDGVEISFYNEHYQILRRSYSEFAAAFHQFRITYASDASPGGMIRDPLAYRGSALRFTPCISEPDNVIGSLIQLGERLACGTTGGGEESTEPAGAAAQLSIEVAAHPSPGHSVTRFAAAGENAMQSLLFPLDCPDGTESLRMVICSRPGLVEIEEMTLLFEQPGQEIKIGPEKMQTMLRILHGGTAIAPSRCFRILISGDAVHAVLRGWNKITDARPSGLMIRMRSEHRFVAPVMLSAVVLNTINRERNVGLNLAEEVEDLRAKTRTVYPGSGFEINFTPAGNGSLFTGDGWSQPEPWGTWTDGGNAVLKIHLRERPRQSIRIEVRARGFVVPRRHPSLRVQVGINGFSVAELKLTSPDSMRHGVTLPAGKFVPGENEITFEIAEPASPEQLGVSADRRRLGLGVERITFQWES